MAKKEEQDSNQDQDSSLTKAQEMFCQLCANPPPIGAANDSEAYVKAYPSSQGKKDGHSGAWRLMQMPKIVKRITEIRRENASKSDIDPRRVLAELGKIAFSNIKDYVRWDSEGNIEALSSDELTGDQKAAIHEVFGRDGWRGRRVRLYDKLSALDKLMKYLGLFTEKVDVTSGGESIRALTDDERVARISELLERARARRGGLGDSGSPEE